MSEIRATAVWLAALALAGCELFADADRSRIPHGTGGAGGDDGHDAGAAGGPDAGPDTGAPVACIHGFDCPATGNECSLPTCVDGGCVTQPAPAGKPTSMQVPYDCMRSVCDGAGHAELVVDLTDVPVDGNPCTDDLCSGGDPINLPSAAGTPCPVGVCDGQEKCVDCVDATSCGPEHACIDNVCVATTCDDNVEDGSETDVDCGGAACPPCGVNKMCAAPSDCASGVCAAKTCVAPTCHDGVKNGDETDVDCGGSCMACEVGGGCVADTDCVGGVCDGGTCQPTCADGELDGMETDTDCGGPACPTCPAGKKCFAPVDCATGVCTGGGCAAAAATCSDKVKDGGETDVDCGGPSCPACAIGGGCAAAADCLSGRCGAGACAPRVVVSQVRSRGPLGPYDEFVELYNPTRVAETLDASWTLSTRSALGTCAAQDERILFTAAGQTLAPHGHLLLGGSAYAEPPSPDAALGLGGVEDAASVVLRQGAVVVSALCYQYDATTLASLSSCSVPYVCEGTPASNLPHDNTGSAQSLGDASLDRKPCGALGNTAISGDSSADFMVITPALPESAASPPVP